ncbi:suppressor of lurcher protein 1 isoform X1 [Culex pipiens pallens]|uniref:suppressor of lurcher protein 1 isoform X1 n=1 Tax=Culex pipiens pallens TaxID=42434 RepID=UPI0019531606|nr:suppressor of lurcher protein 1 isoform X1 [Culex pipiens pallens]XP_039443050.1 suppressor of lurcher protein 1 isoform X1 [Culex pipiens pallens]XP_039443051.1 suppressor of lurcher protein 1 isoform X1 [Culex pipiens pallens]XP_039443053.1 suppressor of lurcher protein 1 isoform X1 [Culex pipiens pallens]XP_039443055.1 suppressor of lurcher protein 1 isoform X1 [Culex pipiens pallens]XP_052565150.1 suppressor of lurcher protein 1 isoform X1 [Culex pipiens pallens]XP_052565151.1 suppress
MKQTHLLVKVTNFALALVLVLPPVARHGTTMTVGVAAAPPAGGEPPEEFLPSANAIVGAATGSGKGLQKDSDVRNETFKSSWTRNGSIAPSHSKHSGLFPSVVIRRYEFTGEDTAERIQIVFSEFRLPSKLEPNECGEMDILLIYFKVDGRDEVVETLCGDTLPKPILSNGPWLMLEFRSTYNNTENKGFTADFSFVTNYGVTTGYQPNKTDCTFHYFKNASSQGWIQSPNFPGAYPRNIRCNYFFYGDPLDYVLIRFTYFDIEGILPCDENSASDTVEFSNFVTRDRKFGLYCGARRDLIVRSDGRFFRVTLATNDRLDGTGFRALYAFESTIAASMAQGPGSGVGGVGLVGVVGAAGVPYLSHHQYHQIATTERSAATVSKMGKSGAGSRRKEICSNAACWFWLVFVAATALNRSQLAMVTTTAMATWLLII